MPVKRRFNLLQSLKVWVVGRSLDPSDSRVFHNLSLIALFAWVGLGADGLSSSAYGPPEAFRALGEHSRLGLLVALGSALTASASSLASVMATMRGVKVSTSMAEC